MAQKYPCIPKIDIRANKKSYGKDIDSTSLREAPPKNNRFYLAQMTQIWVGGVGLSQAFIYYCFYDIFNHYIRLKVHFFVPNPKSQVPNLPKSMGWVGYWTYIRKVCENGKMWKHLEKTLLRVDLSGPAQGNPLGKKQSKHSLCLSKPRQYGQDCLETIL